MAMQNRLGEHVCMTRDLHDESEGWGLLGDNTDASTPGEPVEPLGELHRPRFRARVRDQGVGEARVRTHGHLYSPVLVLVKVLEEPVHLKL